VSTVVVECAECGRVGVDENEGLASPAGRSPFVSPAVSCSTDYDVPAVAFNRDNITEIKATLDGVQIRGPADFAFAIGEAINDFDH
jgi:hypothetical protein